MVIPFKYKLVFMRGLLLAIVILPITISGCGNTTSNKESGDVLLDRVLQHENGTLVLDIEEASCYSDMNNPSVNTAEWNAVIVKSGRYDVWISSSTVDSTSLNYENPVHLHFNDVMLDATPRPDKVLSNSSEDLDPLFQIDSYLGTVYIQDTGIIDFQLICEKIVPEDFTGDTHSKLLSLSFKPEDKRR